VLSSDIIVTQLSIAPEITPGNIIGSVILKNVFKFDAPKDIAASSILKFIWCKIAALDLIV
jgi:hypothetical protein